MASRRPDNQMQQSATPNSRVLRFVDSDNYGVVYGVFLYDAAVAVRAKTIVALAASVRTWGDLRNLKDTQPSELIDPILKHVWWSIWLQSNDSERSKHLGANPYDSEAPKADHIEALLAIHPDEQELSIQTDFVPDDSWHNLMDPWSPSDMGVPEELHEFYVEYLPGSEDLPEIVRKAEGLGWHVEKGDPAELPHCYEIGF